MPSRSGSPCDDKNPHISGGITADGAQIPAARRGKNIARAPFISRLIPATTQVGIWAPGQPVVRAARADGLQGQRSRTGHPPDDLLLIANPANALQAQIGQLRRTFGAAAILTSDAGYALAVGPDDVDVVRFGQLVDR